jgi:hypothetical protein
MKKHGKPGCSSNPSGCGCTAPTCATLCVQAVNACTLAGKSGVSVTVKLGGTTVATGTTNFFGNYCVNVANGVYTVTLVDSVTSITKVKTITIASCISVTSVYNFVQTITANVNRICGATGTATATVSSGATVGTCSITGTSCTVSVTGVDLEGATVTVSIAWKGRTYTTTFVAGRSSCRATAVDLFDSACVSVMGCNAAYQGATVDFVLTGYGAIGTATTDSAGLACIVSSHGLASGDTIQVTVTGSGRFGVSVTTFTLPCAGGCGTGCVTVTLSPASGYACWCCNEPIKTTLNGSDSVGSFTLTYDGAGNWRGCVTRTAGNAFVETGGVCPAGVVAGASVPVYYAMLAGSCLIGATISACNSGNLHYPQAGLSCGGSTGTHGSTGGAGSPTIVCPPVFNATATYVIPAFGGGATPNDPLGEIFGYSTTQHITVTE